MITPEQLADIRTRAERSVEDVPAPCDVCDGTGKIRHEMWSEVAMDYRVSYSTCTGGCVNGAVMYPVDDEIRAVSSDVTALVSALREAWKERDMWKRRAEQHGCNVEEGDPDCG